MRLIVFKAFFLAVFFANAAQAGLTPKEVWKNLLNNAAFFGAEVSAEEQLSVDGILSLHDVSFDFAIPNADAPDGVFSARIKIPSMRFTPIDGEAVKLTFSEARPISVDIRLEIDKADFRLEAKGDIHWKGYERIATESGNRISAVSTARQLNVNFEIIAEVEGGEESVTYAFSGRDLSSNRSYAKAHPFADSSQSLRVAQVAFDEREESEGLVGIAGETLITSTVYKNIRTDASLDLVAFIPIVSTVKKLIQKTELPSNADYSQISEQFRALAGSEFHMDFQQSVDSGAVEIRMESDEDAPVLSYTIGQITAQLQLDQDRIEFSERNGALNVWPGPRFIAAYGEAFSELAEVDLARLKKIISLEAANIHFSAPLSRSDNAPEIAFSSGFQHLEIDPVVWNAFDPNASLKRLPINFNLSFEMPAKWKISPFEFVADAIMDRPSEDEVPIDIYGLKINDYSFSALGAKLKLRGEIMFDNFADIISVDADPEGEGSFLIQTDGLEVALSDLTIGGLIPKMGTVMVSQMIQQFMVPDREFGPNGMRAEIELRLPYEVTVNGTPIPLRE